MDLFLLASQDVNWGSRGLMVRESDLWSKGCGFESQVRQGLKVGTVNEQHSLHLQYHDWGALEQGTEPPIAPRALEQWLPPGVCSQCVCSLLTAVCVHLDGLNAEHQFRVWVTILDNTSHYIILLYYNWWTGVVWFIVMFLSPVWTLILTALIHCRGSIGEQVMWCYISPNLMKKETQTFIFGWTTPFGSFWRAKATHLLTHSQMEQLFWVLINVRPIRRLM